MESYNQINKQLKKSINQMIAPAVLAYNEKDYEESRRILEAIPDSLKNEKVYFLLGHAYKKLKRTNKAKECYKKVLEENPKNKYTLFALGNIYRNLGEYDKAEKLIKEVLIQDNDDIHAKHELGMIYIQQKNYNEAKVLFKQILELNKNDLYSKLALTRLYVKDNFDENSQLMCKYVFDNIAIKEQVKTEQLKMHWNDNLSQARYGVFTIDREELKERINFRNIKKQKLGALDLYCAKVENCGYEGGYNGDGHILNYVTIITHASKLDIIAMFPSDKIIMEKRKENIELER